MLGDPLQLISFFLALFSAQSLQSRVYEQAPTLGHSLLFAVALEASLCVQVVSTM
jgi:hypothetical protein